MNALKKSSPEFDVECGTRSAESCRPHSELRTPNSELKLLHERLWHFTSVGMGNCRAAQRVRREIEQHQSRSGTGVSPVSSSSRTGADARATIEQLTAGLAHLKSLGLANSCAAQIVRGELNRQLLIQSALLLANADFDSNEPRDKDGRWTEGGETAGSATNKPDQHVTRPATGAPASWPGAMSTNDPNQYTRTISDTFPSKLNAATNTPAQTSAATKPNDWLPDNGKPDAVELSISQMLGQLLDRAGEEVRDTVAADWFALIGDPQDALKQAGATSDQLKAMGFKDVEEDSGTTGGKPFEQGMQTLPPAPQAISRGAEGIVKSAPRLAIAEANPVAGALAFGTTSDGFDPKQALIAAALPFIGKYTGEITAAMAARAGVSSDIALQAFNKMGGAAGVTAVIGTDQLQQIMKLPSEQRKQALIDAAGTLGAMFILGTLSGAKPDDETAPESKVATPQQPGEYSGQISKIQDVLSGKTEEAAYAPVSPDTAAKIKNATGRDVSGYQHLIDRDALIHIHKQHGVGREDQAGHEPVTRDDIEKIPQIVASPDKVEDGGITSRGAHTIRYTKRFNGTTYYVEEEWSKDKILAAKTMYKIKN